MGNTKITELVETLAAMCVTECAPNFIQEYMCTVASSQIGDSGCDTTDMLGYLASFDPESTLQGGYYMVMDMSGYYGYGFSSKGGYYSYYQSYYGWGYYDSSSSSSDGWDLFSDSGCNTEFDYCGQATGVTINGYGRRLDGGHRRLELDYTAVGWSTFQKWDTGDFSGLDKYTRSIMIMQTVENATSTPGVDTVLSAMLSEFTDAT